MFPDILGWMRIAGIALLVAGVVGVVAYAKGNADGRAYERAKQDRASLEAIEQRGQINEDVRRLDDGSLLCDILGGLPNGCH
jgi:hypothetical protein